MGSTRSTKAPKPARTVKGDTLTWAKSGELYLSGCGRFRITNNDALGTFSLHDGNVLVVKGATLADCEKKAEERAGRPAPAAKARSRKGGNTEAAVPQPSAQAGPANVQGWVNEMVWRHGDNLRRRAEFPDWLAEVGLSEKDVTDRMVERAIVWCREKRKDNARRANADPKVGLKCVEGEPRRVEDDLGAGTTSPGGYNGSDGPAGGPAETTEEDQDVEVTMNDAVALLEEMGLKKTAAKRDPAKVREYLNDPVKLLAAKGVRPTGKNEKLFARIATAVDNGKEIKVVCEDAGPAVAVEDKKSARKKVEANGRHAQRTRGKAKGPDESGAVDVDRFGSRLGSKAAAVNAVLTSKPKTMKQIMVDAGQSDTFYNHLKKLVERGVVRKTDGGFCLVK